MKLKKIFSGITALLMGAAVLTACSDTDDYFANTTPLLNDGSVVTGSSDVTATTATFHVSGSNHVERARRAHARHRLQKQLHALPANQLPDE